MSVQCKINLESLVRKKMMTDDLVTKDDCAGYRKSFGKIHGVIFVLIGIVMTVLVGAAWAGYSARADLHTHTEVQLEHDKHIERILVKIEATLAKLDERFP